MKAKTKKEMVVLAIALHPYQAALIRGLQSKKINLETDSLREIARKCGDKKESAQQVIHHIKALAKLGAIQFIHGQYVYLKPKI